MFSVHCIVFSIHRIVNTMQCTLYIQHYIHYIYTVYNKYNIGYTMHCLFGWASGWACIDGALCNKFS